MYKVYANFTFVPGLGLGSSGLDPNTVEPHYNEVLGTMKITLLYQVSHYTAEPHYKEVR